MEKKLRRLLTEAEYYDDGSFIYARRGKELYKLAVFDNGFYRLRMFNGVPILEIDGLRMHLVRDFKTPLDYSREVVKMLRMKPRDTVLDTCMGLGYTAIEASNHAAHVITCEISDAVMELAKWNPWSEALFKSKKIQIVRGDAFEKIKSFPDSSFDSIIHDPPRFSRAGELYSLGFYAQMLRVLKPGGRMFHYVGSPGKGRGRDIGSEVAGRLGAAGFFGMSYIPRLQGVLASKAPIR